MSPRSLVGKLWYALLWCPCWAIAVLAFRLRSSGREHVPERGPVLLVSNHQSHLDPVLVGIVSPRQIRSLARHSLFFWPLGWLIHSLGAVPIDRERGGLGGIKATLKLLHAGEAVLLFPEGTRTRDGALQPFLPGFCALARRSGTTIVPIAIDGAFAAMPRSSLFPRPRPISVTICPPIRPAELQRLNDMELAALVRERIARHLPASSPLT